VDRQGAVRRGGTLASGVHEGISRKVAEIRAREKPSRNARLSLFVRVDYFASTKTMAEHHALFTRSLKKSYPMAVRGEGAWIWDRDGNRYLDFSASAVVNFIGHGDRDVIRAISDQLGKLEFVHSSQFVTEAAEEFAKEILDFAGPHFEGGAVFFTSGGSEAVESAMKLARQYQVEIGEPQRTEFLSRRQAYHGSTVGAMSLSDNRKRKEIYQPLLRDYPRVATPYCYRCEYGCEECASRYVHQVESALNQYGDSMAAFFFEPISGATIGAAVPPEGYLERVAGLCREKGVLVVADEVMTGFGRTGRNFAVDHWNVSPDILVAGKGIASGYLPLGAVIASRKVVDAIAAGSGALVHGFTYNAHPVACAAGREVLRKTRMLVSEADSGDTHHEGTGTWMKRGLGELRNLASVGDVRGKGLLWAVEFVADRKTKAPFSPELGFGQRVAAAAMRRGVMTYPMQGCVDGVSGDHLMLAPPAVIGKDEVAWAIEQLTAAIREAEAYAPGGLH
jgi:adenosylmethionine-8-amino-7-oxononanoate aminotransferase